jgi:hypothetical protein
MDADLIRRVEDLEETVESLRDLPDRTAKLEARMGAVETQIVQLRTEMRDEFSAIRRDMVTKDDLRDELSRFATKDELRHELSRFATKGPRTARFATRTTSMHCETKSEKTSPTWAVTSPRDYWNRRVGRAS